MLKNMSAEQKSDTGLLFLRLALAAVFIAHGWSKWSNLEGTVGFFAMLGVPAFLAYAVAAVELLGGLAMLAGVWTEVAGPLLAAVMIGAIYLVKLPKGLMSAEFEFTLLTAALAVALLGSGNYSVKRWMKKDQQPMM